MKLASLLLIILALSFHLVVHFSGTSLKFSEKYKLGGYVPIATEIDLTDSTFLSTDWQFSKEKTFKQQFELLPFYVRLNNQLRYDLFGELKNDIIEGDNGYLFEPMYQASMTGRDYLGYHSIASRVGQLKEIIDYNMQHDGPKILSVFAINKNLLHLDVLDDGLQPDPQVKTNYKTYRKIMDSLSVAYIDFQQYFSEHQKSSKHPLTTKNGVHWSIYGALKAADSLQIALGEILQKDINRVYFDSILVTSKPRESDIDIGVSLNLLQPMAADTYSYPEFYFHPDSTLYKPNVLLIGDSFCWTLWGQYLPHACWSAESNFLYYYRQLWQVTPDEKHGSYISTNQKLELIDAADVVILLYSTANLNDFGNEFIDEYSERILPHH